MGSSLIVAYLDSTGPTIFVAYLDSTPAATTTMISATAVSPPVHIAA
jgi:hypothetical protein